MLLKLLRQLQARVNHPQSELTPVAATFLDTILSKLCMMIPIVILFHKGVFYLYGRYYSLGRRIAGLDYVKVNVKYHEHKFLTLFLLLFFFSLCV